ncbi:MAG: hypothetical protein M1819_006380 [Sarea resinae]|nr:MAG: hypothetical protein M1819_006380 [Sarea resinae]
MAPSEQPQNAELNANAEPPSEPPSEQAEVTGKKHSVFTKNQKRCIILAASFAGFFSPLSANIYFPALNTLAKDLHVSSSKINLTVTTYLIFQGVAPAFIGGFSDGAGRRPGYIICFIVYLGANLGLALQNSYTALLILRMVQSSGSSGTVALANAVAADIVTSAERGTYIAYASLGSILGPSLSPVLGGLLSQFCGWKWIFWFLVIFSAAFYVPFLLFFPETCRNIVGDGSIPPSKWCQSLPSLYKEWKMAKAGNPVDSSERNALAKNRHIPFPNPLSTLIIIFQKEAGLILLSNGLLFASYYVVTSSLPSQFQHKYGFNNIQISLLFIPIGGGSIVSAYTTGKILNWNYKRHAKRLGLSVIKSRQQDLSNFPIEKARLEVAFPLLFLGAASIITYGWVLHFPANLAGPIILLFIIGYAMIAGFNCMTILMVDIYPGRPATATAANNLVRCLLGAVGSAVIIPMIDAIGIGWSCTIAGLVWIGFSPLILALMIFGPRWRREAKLEAQRKGEKKRESLNERLKADSTDEATKEAGAKAGAETSAEAPRGRELGGESIGERPLPNDSEKHSKENELAAVKPEQNGGL